MLECEYRPVEPIHLYIMISMIVLPSSLEPTVVCLTRTVTSHMSHLCVLVHKLYVNLYNLSNSVKKKKARTFSVLLVLFLQGEVCY